MRRHLPGLRDATPFPEGFLLVRVTHAQYRNKLKRSEFVVELSVLEPQHCAGRIIRARFDCTAKALWRVNWFLRDFGYDPELLARDEIDDRALVGLRGVVKITDSTVRGHTYVTLDGFAPAADWQEYSLQKAG